MATYHHGDLPTALLEAAGRIVEKDGLAALSVREAARRAGVSHSAPYRHFPDRDALLAALASQSLNDLLKDLENRTGRNLAEAYVRFALGRPRVFRLMFAGRRWPELEARFAEAFAVFGKPAAAAAWSLVHGLALLLIDGHFTEKGREDFAAGVIGALRFAQRSA